MHLRGFLLCMMVMASNICFDIRKELTLYHPNTPTNWWRGLVINRETGLGIDCKMYSLKHKEADDKILSDISLDALKNLYGHRSQQMTKGYARAVKGKYKEEIMRRHRYLPR